MAVDWTSLVGGSVADAVAKIVSLFKIDPTVALQNRTEIERIQLGMQSQLIAQVSAQIAVDQQEAASPSMFVAGWRPAIGWICGLGLFTQFIINPLATWLAALFHHPIAFPSLDLGTLMTLLFGMLGLAAGEHYENVQTAVNGK
jgi:hypothetical protein